MALASELFADIKDLTGRDRLRKLREIKKDLIAQVRELEQKRAELREQRDKENQMVKQLFNEAREARERRDAVNEDVKLSKALRNLRKEDADKALSELERIEEEMQDMGISPRAYSKRRNIAKRIHDLEMRIQTTPNLNPNEEREIVDQIENLTREMDKLEVADEKREEIRAIRKRLKSLRSEALTHHKEVQKLAEMSQEYHDVMISKIKEAKQIRTEADKHHQEILTLSDEIRSLRKQITKISQEADRIRKQLGEETAAERKKRKQQETKKKEEELDVRADELLEKYKSGEKLGFEEFKLLISRGLFNDQ